MNQNEIHWCCCLWKHWRHSFLMNESICILFTCINSIRTYTVTRKTLKRIAQTPKSTENKAREKEKNNTNTIVELTSEQFGFLLKCQRALKQFRSANQITIYFFYYCKIIYFFGFGCVFNFRVKRSRKKKTIALANRMWLRVSFESKRDHVKV